MKGNILEFSKDGKELTIKFESGAESLVIKTKHEAYKKIGELVSKGDITHDEFLTMREQVLDAEKMPESEDSSEPFFASGFPGIIGFLLAISSLNDILSSPDEPVEFAYFKVCKSCGNHGRIYTKSGYTTDLRTKKDAQAALTRLQEKKMVDGDEFDRLQQEIQMSALA
ncbi:MAG TPA: hypothetical protein VGE63_02695 [Candidatus Paceibacterota bacterium]